MTLPAIGGDSSAGGVPTSSELDPFVEEAGRSLNSRGSVKTRQAARSPAPTVVHNKSMQGERVAIFGSGGQLGVELKMEFAARGYQVHAFERTTADITDQHAVERVLARCDASMVINAAAYNQVDVAEKEPQAAFLVNALAVRNLAMACRQADARLIHFSTDYVFDGLAGRAYTEDDAPRPMGAYAVSKLAGELYARAYLDKPLIIRTSGVYGPGGLDTARGKFRGADAEAGGDRASRFAWWRIMSHRRPSLRRWRRARRIWWRRACTGLSTRGEARRFRGSNGR